MDEGKDVSVVEIEKEPVCRRWISFKRGGQQRLYPPADVGSYTSSRQWQDTEKIEQVRSGDLDVSGTIGRLISTTRLYSVAQWFLVTSAGDKYFLLWNIR